MMKLLGLILIRIQVERRSTKQMFLSLEKSLINEILDNVIDSTSEKRTMNNFSSKLIILCHNIPSHETKYL